MTDRQNLLRTTAYNFFFNRQPVPAQEGETKDWYRIVYNEAEEEADIYIYNEIGGWGTSAQQFAIDLKAIAAKKLNVRINSPGGSVFEGYAIYNQLVDWGKKHGEVIVWVDGWAASIASVIAMAGDTINVYENAKLMIHKPWSFAMGTADDMRMEADILDGLQQDILAIYVARSGGDEKTLNRQINNETWFSAKEAVAAGLADNIIANKQKPDKEDAAAHQPMATMGADFFSAIFVHMPEDIRAALASVAQAATEQQRPAEPVAVEPGPKFNFMAATTREQEAHLRSLGLSHKQAKAAIRSMKQPDEVTAEIEQAARDEQARLAEQTREEAVKAIQSFAAVASIKLAAVNINKNP